MLPFRTNFHGRRRGHSTVGVLDDARYDIADGKGIAAEEDIHLLPSEQVLCVSYDGRKWKSIDEFAVLIVKEISTLPLCQSSKA